MWDAEPIIGADILKLFNVAAQAGATGRPLVEEMDTQGAGEAPQMSQDVVEGMALRTRSLQQGDPATPSSAFTTSRRPLPLVV